jgi:hypothetical protein
MKSAYCWTRSSVTESTDSWWFQDCRLTGEDWPSYGESIRPDVPSTMSASTATSSALTVFGS